MERSKNRRQFIPVCQLPPYREDDLDDCQQFILLILQYGFERHELYRKADLWKRFIQAN